MKQEILQGSELEEQLKKDAQEVIKQLQMLQKALTELKKLIQPNGIENKCDLINENYKYLDNQIKPMIEKFFNKMREFEEKVDQKMKSQFYEAEVQKQYEDFEKQMQQFYDCYRIIWGQIYYFLQRKRIILNQDPNKKSLLINKLL